MPQVGKVNGCILVILPRARTIRAKLALLIAASVGAAVLLSFGIGSYRELSRFADAKRSELEATAQILAATVADSVQREDRSAARQALDAIGRIPDLRFAEIRDANGKLFAEAGIGVALTSDSGARPQSSTIWSMLTNRSVFADADIVKGGRKVGEISLLVDTSELFDRFRQALVAALASAVGAVLVGLVIAARLQRSITRPLGELAQTMNSVRTTSDFTQRAERRSDDETGQLVDSFNDMLDQIRNRDDALEEHRAGLERTVEERTRELADARDVAVSANRAKSDFLATMSHEIRTPLNGMLVVAELLTRGNLPGRQQRYAEIISRSGQTLLSIINDILDLSKIEAGKLTLEQGRIEPAQIVSDVLGLFWERAASKGLDLAGIVAPGVPACVEGDPVRLSQVISNLVNNALKFTERGQVSVEIASIESDGTDFELQISVRDTGIGIAADKLDQVFEAFSQADSSTTRRFGGTGLGLSISQRLVRAMGGRIWVESEPGIGSQFCFTIRAKVLQSADVSPARPAGGPRRAVVAVEGAATRQAIAYALASAGYAVTEAPAGDAVRVDSAADLVFAEAPAAARLAGTARPGSTRVIAVVTPGDSSADALLDSDLLAGSLARPVTSSDVRKLLADVGSESRRASGEAKRGAGCRQSDAGAAARARRRRQPRQPGSGARGADLARRRLHARGRRRPGGRGMPRRPLRYRAHGPQHAGARRPGGDARDPQPRAANRSSADAGHRAHRACRRRRRLLAVRRDGRLSAEAFYDQKPLRLPGAVGSAGCRPKSGRGRPEPGGRRDGAGTRPLPRGGSAGRRRAQGISRARQW